jgi:hypothetical protein
MVIWHIFPFLVCCIKKNLATLDISRLIRIAEDLLIAWEKFRLWFFLPCLTFQMRLICSKPNPGGETFAKLLRFYHRKFFYRFKKTSSSAIFFYRFKDSRSSPIFFTDLKIRALRQFFYRFKDCVDKTFPFFPVS